MEEEIWHLQKGCLDVTFNLNKTGVVMEVTKCRTVCAQVLSEDRMTEVGRQCFLAHLCIRKDNRLYKELNTVSS